MRQAFSRPAARALLAGLLPLPACALQWLCWPLIQPLVWFLFYPVVFLSAWVGGFGAGLAATSLATALVWWFFMPPVHTLVKPAPGTYLNAAMFLAMGWMFAYFHRRACQASRRAARTELLKRDDLLDRTSRLAHVGGWEFDVATLEGSWSEETARIHDLPPDSPIDVRSGLAYCHEEGLRWIRIADNGCGFNMADAHKLFQPFQRLHRQEEFPGLGIGLATVRRIVQRHGGEIRAVAEPGLGAAFLLTLPEPVEASTGSQY